MHARIVGKGRVYKVIDILDAGQVRTLLDIADGAAFADGRSSNPHNTAKSNLQLNDPQAYSQSAAIIQQALVQNREFVDFAFPVVMCPPLTTRYRPGMKYGAHTDNAFIQLPNRTVRSDLSCTIFLSEPGAYDGGALRVWHGSAHFDFKLKPGQAIVYPSNALHEVMEVTSGERTVAITFIQSRIADAFTRNLLYELNEVAALEGLKMSHENYTRLQWVQQSLLRHWGEAPPAG